MKRATMWVAICAPALMFAQTSIADHITYDAGGLDFSSADQSMWGPGEAFQLDETYFVGAQWNETTSFGSIGNFPGTGGTIPNPARPLYDAAFATCRLVSSASICRNGGLGIPGLGSRPSATLPNPIPAVAVGMEATLTTNGRVGFEFGVTIDSGSVNADVGYDRVLATIPDAVDAGNAGGVVNLNPMADLTGDELNSQFPTIVLTSGLVFDVFAEVSGQACVGFCVSFNPSVDVNPDLPIVSFNEDGAGGIEWFGGDPTLEALINFGGGTLPSGFPVEGIELGGGLVEVDLFLPQPNATYDGTDGTSLLASGQDDLINIGVDLDNIASLVATSGATQNIFGGSLDLGLGSINWDFIDVDLGPALDLRQEFTLTPTLMVDLMFSRPIEYLGEFVTFVNGLEWQSLPSFIFGAGETLVTPTFYLQYGADRNTVNLLNQLILDINGRLEIDLLSFGFSIGRDLGALGNYSLSDSWALASIVEEFDIGQIPLFTTDFAMGGFNEIQAASFTVQVSEPGTLALMILGLLLLGLREQRRGGHSRRA